MKRNYRAGLITAMALALLAFLAWRFLEVQDRQIWRPPSREARANDYLALDRWLEAMGRPVRVTGSGNLDTVLGAEERQIYMQASLFRWTDEAVMHLIRWISDGGSLFLALDYHAGWELFENSALLELLGAFGVEACLSGEIAPMTDRQAANIVHGRSFAPNFFLRVSQDEDAIEFKDPLGRTRLARITCGAGRLIVSGRPLFLRSENIRDTDNAYFAWRFFVADFAENAPSSAAAGSENGWLFIRGATREQGLVGSLFRHGNFVAVIASALVLLAVGFWAVIPMFGLVRRDDERSGKPLRERFAAEGRFLKKYGALGFYRDTYVKEIRRRLARKEGISGNDEIAGRALDILGKTGEERDGRLLAGAFRGEPIAYREFPRMIAIFRTILERI